MVDLTITFVLHSEIFLTDWKKDKKRNVLHTDCDKPQQKLTNILKYMHELIHRMIIADNFVFSFTVFHFGAKD